ncbi:MAG: malonic semialdehyde reductase [Caulobacterales bacterium]
MSSPINDAALDQMFRSARSRNAWHEKDVPETLIKAAYELTKMGPTSANGSPARFYFVHSPAAKEKLKPFVMEANLAKTMAAPWVVIFATDMKFFDKMDRLFPPKPEMGQMFAGMPAGLQAEHALRNATLQAAYFMLACRSLGLDCGPMSGFDQAGVDQAFFAGDKEMGSWKSNFLCNVGYGSDTPFPRLPRLSFEEACRIA